MSPSKSKNLTPSYAVIQGLYWMYFAAIMSFSGFFLLSGGFTNTQIGILAAIAGLLSAVLQPVLVDHLVALQINRRKTRSVGNKAAILLEQFNHARGVATSAKLVADLARCELKTREEHIEQRGLADAAVARKGADLAAQKTEQRVSLGSAVG